MTSLTPVSERGIQIGSNPVKHVVRSDVGESQMTFPMKSEELNRQIKGCGLKKNREEEKKQERKKKEEGASEFPLNRFNENWWDKWKGLNPQPCGPSPTRDKKPISQPWDLFDQTKSPMGNEKPISWPKGPFGSARRPSNW